MRLFVVSSRRRHTRLQGDWSSDVCSSDLDLKLVAFGVDRPGSDYPFPSGTVYHREPSQDGLPKIYEIGRASCRARGEGLVGADVLAAPRRRAGVSRARDDGGSATESSRAG